MRKPSGEKNDLVSHRFGTAQMRSHIVKIALVTIVIFTITPLSLASPLVPGMLRCMRRGPCPQRVHRLAGETDVYAGSYRASEEF